MASYVYIKSEAFLWTVGFYDPDGKWHPDSDQDSKEDAANRVRFLNGGFVTVGDEDLKDRECSKGVVLVKMDFQDDDVKFHEEAEVKIPVAYQATGKQSAIFALLEMTGMLPTSMNPETAKSIGLKEIELPESPNITIIIDGKAIQLDLLQFTSVADVVAKMLDMLESKDNIVSGIRQYSGRN